MKVVQFPLKHNTHYTPGIQNVMFFDIIFTEEELDFWASYHISNLMVCRG